MRRNDVLSPDQVVKCIHEAVTRIKGKRAPKPGAYRVEVTDVTISKRAQHELEDAIHQTVALWWDTQPLALKESPKGSGNYIVVMG